MTDILFRAGECTVFASEGQYTDAMPEILIGSINGPVGHAFANMMGQSAGHTRMFAVRDCNQLVRPTTMMISKVTIKTMEYANLFGGIVQAATADAVLDCVIEGIIPRIHANDLAILDMIWLDERCATHAELDRDELYKNNYDATKIAISRALATEPSIDELIANRHKIKHYALG